MFSVTYYPIFQNIRNTLQENHLLLLAPDKEYKNIPVVKFCNDRSIKDYITRAALPKTNETRN